MAAKTQFIDPMLLLRSEALPDDAARWAYQLKLDGYRAIAFKTGGNIYLRSLTQRQGLCPPVSEHHRRPRQAAE